MIRKARLEDSEAIAKVQVASWKTTYLGIVLNVFLEMMNWKERESIWKDVISSQIVYVAENKDKHIVGFCLAGKGHLQDYLNFKGELYSFYLLKQFQRKGIGKKLFNRIIEDLQEEKIDSCIVKVLDKNPSKHFYEFMGAKYIETIKIEIYGDKLNERVYGWRDIGKINTK